MPNKKISQLSDAAALTGGEHLELVQGGVNLKTTAQDIADLSTGITREFDRAWSSEILFNKNEIAYAEHELTGNLNYTVADSGNLLNEFCSATQIVETDGTRTVTFTGWDFVLGDIQSGAIPDAGTYLVLFLYWNGVSTVNWTRPSLEVANLTPLSAPANFAAAANGETQIDLSWDTVANAQSYQIYYSLTGSDPWILLTSPASGATTYSHTGLSPGDQRFYRIRAIGDLVSFSNSVYSLANATTNNSGDATAPTFTFSPVDTATDIPVNGRMIITCSEPIRDADGVTEITSANVANYITAVNSSAAAQSIVATIDASKTIITIDPDVVWTELDDITITIDGVEDVNGNESVADSATFTTSDYTLTQTNFLNLGDILDPLFTANDTDFDLVVTVKEMNTSVLVQPIFRKYATNERAFIYSKDDIDAVFKFYEAGTLEPDIDDRKITWGTPGFSGEHIWTLQYRGAIDTNNGLDRVTLLKDGVPMGSKSLEVGGTNPWEWPFTIRSVAADLLIGPTNAQVKDAKILSSNGTVTEVDIPIFRTGIDVSGNNRHGTWV